MCDHTYHACIETGVQHDIGDRDYVVPWLAEALTSAQSHCASPSYERKRVRFVH